MFINYLLKESENDFYHLTREWQMFHPSLIRVPFFDTEDPNFVYAVTYSEAEQKYYLIKVLISSGEIVWSTEVVNGGYGTPAILKNTVIMLKGFSDIVGLDKTNGAKLWEIKTEKRIRTSISVFDNMAYWASGDSIYVIDEFGNIINKIRIENSFIYGHIYKTNNTLLALGTKYNSFKEDSYQYLWIVDINNNLIESIETAKSNVISSDTSGFFVDNEFVYVPCEEQLFKINYKTKEVVWSNKVGGYAGRHLPIVYKGNIYYTTINGLVGKMNVDGDKIWEIKTKEESIMSPPTIVGKTLFVIADGYIYSIDLKNGNIFERNAIGHSPYSACVIKDKKLFIGAGEPPINGQLICFNLTEEIDFNTEVLINSYLTNNKIEDEIVSVTINFYKKINNAHLDTSVISDDMTLKGVINNDSSYSFRIKLKSNLIPGYYALPIRFEYKGIEYNESLVIAIETNIKLPNKRKLYDYEKLITEDHVLYSGNAITELIFTKIGKDVNQKELRKIIEYIKEKSNLEDADFQTWRLVLKRALSSPANTLEEFIKNEEKE